MLTILYIINMLYYAFSITYIYTHLLTLRRNVKKPFVVCFIPQCALLLFNVYFLVNDPATATVLTYLFIFLPLFLFRDSWFKRVLCYIVVFVTQLLAEMISYLVTGFFQYLFTDGPSAPSLLEQQEIKSTAVMILMILIFGTTLTILLTPFYQKWIHYFLTPTLILLGIPIIISMVSYAVWDLHISKAIPLMGIILLIPICLLCYPPLFHGLKELRRQAERQALLEKQHDLMEKQFQYISELETDYRELCKWNHDISNHLLSVSWLMEQKNYEEADSYLESISNHNFDQKSKEENQC